MLKSELVILALNGAQDEYIISAGQRLGYLAADKGAKGGARRILTLALAAALVLGLGAAAYAGSVYAPFFKNAFGMGIAQQEAHSVELIAPDGKSVKTETYPASTREEADEAQSDTLIGEYVSPVGQSVQVGDYTVTVREAVLDVNGIGAVSVDIDSPNGHGFAPDGTYSELTPEVFFGFNPHSQSGTPIAARDYPVQGSYSTTHISFVYYLAPPVALAPGEDIILRFEQIHRDSNEREGAEIVIPAAECVPARSFSAEGATAALSPVGLTLNFGTAKGDAIFEEYIIGDLLITFADGSEYTVKAAGVNNSALGTYDINNVGIHKFAFNRLVDIESAESIFVRVSHSDSQGATEEVYTLK